MTIDPKRLDKHNKPVSQPDYVYPEPEILSNLNSDEIFKLFAKHKDYVDRITDMMIRYVAIDLE